MSSPVQLPPDMDALRHTIRETRRSQGLTQQELGEMAGVDHRSVSAIERGRMDPSAKTLLLILGALGVISLGLYLASKGGQKNSG